MLRRGVFIVLTGLLAGAAGPALAQGSAESFLREIYRPYERGAAPRDFGMRDGASILSPRFRALVLKDRAQANGEIGVIDGDPLCQCQDVVRFRLTEVQTGGDSANALMSVRYRNGDDAGAMKVLLVMTERGWLIDDIVTRDVPSYRTILKSQLR